MSACMNVHDIVVPRSHMLVRARGKFAMIRVLLSPSSPSKSREKAKQSPLSPLERGRGEGGDRGTEGSGRKASASSDIIECHISA